MEYNTDHFLSMLAKMNISLSDKQLQQFMTYYQSQGIQPVQILYPPRFYAQQKS